MAGGEKPHTTIGLTSDQGRGQFFTSANDGAGRLEAGLWRLDLLAIGLTVIVVLVVTIPRLPPGICFGDSGDLQLASATLGIAHPPGYAGFVSLGFLVSRLPGVEPAYLVSLACLGAGVASIVLCVLLQIRLGLHSFAACAIALALCGHSRFWGNLVVAEVYAPSLAFVAGGGYFLIRYRASRCRRDLFIAAVLVGIALANRPPVLLMLPGFAVAWWLTERARESSLRARLTSATLCIALLALPCLYSIGYVWVRDRPQTPYNYIEQYNAETGELPAVEEGTKAKLTRVGWLISGKQYANRLGISGYSGARSRLKYIRGRIGPERTGTLAIVGVIVLWGAIATYRRSKEGFWVLVGVAGGSVLFLLLYDVRGDAANVLPPLWVVAIFAGSALTPLMPCREGGRYRKLVALALLVIAITWTVMDAPSRWDRGVEEDATGYLSKIDIANLPKDSVICSTWGTSPPLWYATRILTGRADIRVINAEPGAWLTLINQLGRGNGEETPPVYLTEPIDLPEGWNLVPSGNLLRHLKAKP